MDTGVRMDRVIAIEIVSNKYRSGALDGFWNIQSDVECLLKCVLVKSNGELLSYRFTA